MGNPVLRVENLTKRYGDVQAVRGISFEVAEGEVFGLLGPNGAGKTSTVEIRRNPEDLLKRFGLEEKRNSFYGQLSGGQKQRLALAIALVNDPKVVFLDEPTAGLDPQVRREIYDVIEELRRDKKTIVLTTHYIEEAERLCDRVAIVDHGKVIAQGTPRELKQTSADKTRIEVRLAREESEDTLKSLEGVSDCRSINGLYVLHCQRPPQAIVSLVKYLEAQNNELIGLEIATPSLEDVFIELTGRRLRD